MTQGPLLVTRQGAIATLLFNRPEAMNALDVPTARALLAAMQDIAQDTSVRAVLLKGAGRAFVAGGDLATLQADPVQGAADLLAPMTKPNILNREARWLARNIIESSSAMSRQPHRGKSRSAANGSRHEIKRPSEYSDRR